MLVSKSTRGLEAVVHKEGMVTRLSGSVRESTQHALEDSGADLMLPEQLVLKGTRRSTRETFGASR